MGLGGLSAATAAALGNGRMISFSGLNVGYDDDDDEEDDEEEEDDLLIDGGSERLTSFSACPCPCPFVYT